VEKIKCFLDKNKIEYFENYDVSWLSSIKIGGYLILAIFPKTKRELIKTLTKLNSSRTYYKVVGNASNLLFVRNINYPVVITSKMSDELEIKKNLVTVSSGMLLPKFCDLMRKNGLSGVEGLIGIPATIGGAIANNAGAYGFSISDKLVEIEVFFNGKVFKVKRNEIKFFYHGSNLNGFIILSATFLFENKNEYDIIKLSNEFTYKRNCSQPSGLSLGSVYRKINGKSAGFYIERSGLKGLRMGGIVISTKHSNFFINDKGGSVIDFLRLSTIVEREVEKQFGLTLIPEIEKVGDKDETFSRLSHSYKV